MFDGGPFLEEPAEGEDACRLMPALLGKGWEILEACQCKALKMWCERRQVVSLARLRLVAFPGAARCIHLRAEGVCSFGLALEAHKVKLGENKVFLLFEKDGGVGLGLSMVQDLPVPSNVCMQNSVSIQGPSRGR